jgi:hypothetical protein
MTNQTLSIAESLWLLRKIRRPINSNGLTNPSGLEDLPDRFILGELESGSFQRDVEGWSATYQTEPFRLDLAYSKGRLHPTAKVDGAFVGGGAISASDSARMFAGCKEAIDREAKRWFESRYSVVYSCGHLDKEIGSTCYVPDGFAVSILLPFPFFEHQVTNLLRMLRAVREGRMIHVSAHLRRGLFVTNFREHFRHDIELTEQSLLARDCSQGFIPIERPQWEGPSEDRALTARRIGYTLIIDAFLADLNYLLGLLVEHGLADCGASSDLFPNIVDTILLLFSSTVACFSPDNSKRRILHFRGVERSNDLLRRSGIQTSNVEMKLRSLEANVWMVLEEHFKWKRPLARSRANRVDEVPH